MESPADGVRSRIPGLSVAFPRDDHTLEIGRGGSIVRSHVREITTSQPFTPVPQSTDPRPPRLLPSPPGGVIRGTDGRPFTHALPRVRISASTPGGKVDRSSTSSPHLFFPPPRFALAPYGIVRFRLNEILPGIPSR